MCNHENYEIVGDDYYTNANQDLVEVTKFLCLDCGLEGYKEVVYPVNVTWKDPYQTKLLVRKGESEGNEN